MTRFEILAEGFVSQRQPGTPTAVAAGPRCALTRQGELVCTFMAQSELGINDFVPMIARSADGGLTWREQGPVWPALAERWSIFCVISRAPDGDLYIYGTRYPIDVPGESFWSEATQGLKQNELFWSRSTDEGYTWSAPAIIPMPIPGSAEAPGVLCITRAGRWLACYAPYHTFDPSLTVDRSQIVLLGSDDQGQSWWHTSMLRFAAPHLTGAEAWVMELADGRVLGTSWNLNQQDGSDLPDAYALSLDGGKSWTPTRSTGIQGQATSLTPLADGRTLFIYNQRKHGEVGVWCAVVQPTPEEFGALSNQILWRAQTTTQSGSDGGHSGWVDYAFGEPQVTVLPDGTLLLVLWCIQPSGQGIRYVKFQMVEE